jgi:hypothetical protein
MTDRLPTPSESNAARITRVEDVQTRQDADRVRDLERDVAVHDVRLKDHDEVLRELKDHLGGLLARFDSFERKALFVAGAFFLSSGKAEHLLAAVGLG